MAVEYKGVTTSETDGMIFLENAESGTYTLKVTGTGKGSYTVVVGQITADNDYWDNITGQITAEPASSQTDYYTINYPSSPLAPKGSKSGTGGSSTPSTTSTTTTTTSTTDTSTSTNTSGNNTGVINWLTNILGASDESESTQSSSPSPLSPTTSPSAYTPPRPGNPWILFLMLWLVGSGLLLLLVAWLLSRNQKL